MMIRKLDYLRQVRQVAGCEQYSIAAIGSALPEWQDALHRTGLFVPASCWHKRRKIIHADWDGENILLCMAPVHPEANEAVHDFIHYLLRYYYHEPEQTPARLNITRCSRLMQKNISTRDAPLEAFLFEIYCGDHAMSRRDELQALRRAVSLLTLLADNYCMAHDAALPGPRTECADRHTGGVAVIATGGMQAGAIVRPVEFSLRRRIRAIMRKEPRTGLRKSRHALNSERFGFTRLSRLATLRVLRRCNLLMQKKRRRCCRTR